MAPDMATITLGVTQNGATAKEAVDQVSEAVSGILDALAGMNIAPADTQTNGFYLQPVQARDTGPQDQPPRITGYRAGNTVRVNVRDLDQLGPVLDAVIDLGGNQFDGLRFGLNDDSAARAQARQAAVQDAMTRAQELAQAAGVVLGPVRSIREGVPSAGGPMGAVVMARSAMSEAISEGEIDVTVQVTVVYTIAQ